MRRRGAARGGHTRARVRTRAPPHCGVLRLIPRIGAGRGLAQPHGMIWFFERETDLIVCEIRRAADDDDKFEFEIADAAGPTTRRFESPRELITNYLGEQARLIAAG